MGLGDSEGQGHGPGIRTFLLCGMDLCQVGREPPVRLHGLEEHWYPTSLWAGARLRLLALTSAPNSYTKALPCADTVL